MKISSFHKRKQIEPAYIKFRFTNELKSEPLYLINFDCVSETKAVCNANPWVLIGKTAKTYT